MVLRTSYIVAVIALMVAGTPAASQEAALKGGLAVSRFESKGATPFDDNFIATAFGGHVRFRFGPVGIQPEIQMVVRGGSARHSESVEERLRLEYIELPLMFVLPFQVGTFEPYAFGGPSIALESRCRSIVEEEGLKTNFGCDQPTENVFDRNTFDWGLSAGAGVSHRLGSGRLLLEGRHTWGMRDIYDGDAEDIEIRNRTFILSIGYTISTRSGG
jgi:hypothetical protein